MSAGKVAKAMILKPSQKQDFPDRSGPHKTTLISFLVTQSTGFLYDQTEIAIITSQD